MTRKNIVIQICEDALEGTIKSSELYKRWPKELEKYPYYHNIFIALEDGIEHTPGHFFVRGIDMKSWKNSLEYRRIFFHQKLLRTKKTVKACLKLTELFEETHPRSIEDVDLMFGEKKKGVSIG